MPDTISKINGYNLKDTVSGYITGITIDNNSSTITNIKTSTSHPYNASTNALATLADIDAAGGANDGVLKLQKDTGTASAIFSANQSGDSTVKFTTTSVGSASGWNAGTMAAIDTSKFNGGSFTQGTDSFTANTPTVIDTSKFNGGSFTQGTDSFTKPTHGNDSFTAATMTSSAASTTTSASSPTTLTISFTGGSYTQGTFTQGSFTQGTDSHTAASLSSGFYTAGTAASFTQGEDSHTAASLGTGFYTAGTKPSLTVSSTTVVNDISKVSS